MGRLGRELSTDEAASDVVKKTAASCFSILLYLLAKSQSKKIVKSKEKTTNTLAKLLS